MAAPAGVHAAPRPAPRPPRTSARAPRGRERPRRAPARRARRPAGLLKPTAKAGLALALASGAAAALGAAAGLPIPVLDRQGPSPLSAATVEPPILFGGTTPGAAPGRLHPVVGPFGYGESEARFGDDRGGRMHEGQDIFAKPGTPLVALRDGVVLDTGGARALYPGGGGNYVVIYSPMDDRSYVYLHMLKPALVQEGQRVRSGQLMGQLGCTGSCDGPHLHLEIRLGRADWGVKTKPIDPMPLLKNLPRAEVAPTPPGAAKASAKKAGAGA